MGRIQIRQEGNVGVDELTRKKRERERETSRVRRAMAALLSSNLLIFRYFPFPFSFYFPFTVATAFCFLFSLKDFVFNFMLVFRNHTRTRGSQKKCGLPEKIISCSCVPSRPTSQIGFSRRELMLFGFSSSGALFFPPSG